MDQDILKKIGKSIHQKDPNAKVYLFGSRARGDFHPDSDLDILILIDEPNVTNEIEDKFRDELYNLELESGITISIFIYPKHFWEDTLVYSPLFKAVNKEGILL